MAVGQNLVLVNPKIAGKWMFIPLKMVLIGIDPYPIVGCFFSPYETTKNCHQAVPCRRGTMSESHRPNPLRGLLSSSLDNGTKSGSQTSNSIHQKWLIACVISTGWGH
jgi:hypothetical protein